MMRPVHGDLRLCVAAISIDLREDLRTACFSSFCLVTILMTVLMTAGVPAGRVEPVALVLEGMSAVCCLRCASLTFQGNH